MGYFDDLIPGASTASDPKSDRYFDDLMPSAKSAGYFDDLIPKKATIGGWLKEAGKGIAAGLIGGITSTIKGAGASNTATLQSRIDSAKGRLKVMDMIDSGEKPPVGSIADVDELDIVTVYENASPEERKGLRESQQRVIDTAVQPGNVEDSPLFKAGQTVENWSEEQFKASKEYEDSWTRAIFQGLGSLGTTVAAAVLTKSPTAAGGVGYSMSTGEAVDRAIKAGASQEEVLQVIKFGGAPGLTEQVPIERLFEKIPVGKWGKAVDAVKEVVIQYLVEGGQEAVQQGLQNLIAKFVYNPDQDLTEDIAENFIIGGIVGGIAAGPKAGAHLFGGDKPATTQQRPDTTIPAGPAEPGGPASAGRIVSEEEALGEESLFGPPTLEQPTPQPLPQEPAAVLPTTTTPPPQIDTGERQSALTGLIERESTLPSKALERPESPRLTPEDRASPIPNDLIDDGKRVMEEAAGIDLPGGEPATLAPMRTGRVTATDLASTTIPAPDMTPVGGVEGSGRLAQRALPERAIPETTIPERNIPETTLPERSMPERSIPETTIPERSIPEVTLPERSIPETTLPERNIPAKAEPAAQLALKEKLASRRAEQIAAIDVAAQAAATSTRNNLPQPTEGQQKAGNYQKGHARIAGLDISIENPEGSTRSGVDRAGKKWSTKMKSHYGYIRGTVGKDKDHLDTFVKPGTPDTVADDAPVFVVDQVNDKRKFDEHKVLIGYGTREEANKAYHENYAKGWDGAGAITRTTMREFKSWIKEGDTKRPFAPAKAARPSGYTEDNPATRDQTDDAMEWLRSKQADAEERAATGKSPIAKSMTGGSTTATSGQRAPLFLPVSRLRELPGVMGEQGKRVPGERQFDKLDASVKEKGYTNENPVFVMVNHKGEAFINEGNTRVAVAAANGINRVRAWVNWKNGGETVDGGWSPAKVAEMEAEVEPSATEPVFSRRSEPTPQVALKEKIEAKRIAAAADEPVFARRAAKQPKKTVKAYKLFRTDKAGNLYPLFVDAKQPVSTGVWLDAEVGPRTETGKVKSKLGPLAYRPGWHAGDLPIATHIGAKSRPDLTAPDTRPSDQVWAEVELAADVDWQTEATRRGTNARGVVVPARAQLDEMPVGGHYRYKTNPNMTGEWLIGGTMRVNRVLSDNEVQQINKTAGVSDLPRAPAPAQERFVGGLSLQRSDFVPTNKDMAALSKDIKKAIDSADPKHTVVLNSKAAATEGRYDDIERSLDLEVVAKPEYSPKNLWRTMVSKASGAKQDSLYLSRQLRAAEKHDPLLHTPGVEIYFNEAVPREKLDAELEALGKEGIKYLTVAVDGKANVEPGEMPPAVGVRVQFIPEFLQRWRGEKDEDFSSMTDEQLSTRIKKEAKELARLANRVMERVGGVASAKQLWYETRSAFSHEYQEHIDADSVGRTEGKRSGTGSGTWTGRSVREGLAAADRQRGAGQRAEGTAVLGRDAELAKTEEVALSRRGETRANDEHPNRISTRFPTQVRSTEDPIAQKLIINVEAMKASPAAFDHNMGIVRGYLNMPANFVGTADETATAFKEHIKANLRWLYNQVPAEIREQTKRWYDGANRIAKIWAERYKLPDHSIAGVLAALSPQKDWYQNVSLAERVLDIVTSLGDHPWTNAMGAKAAELFEKAAHVPYLDAARGRTLNQIDPENYAAQALWVRVYDETYNPRGFREVTSDGDFSGEPESKVAWGSLTEIGKAVAVIRDTSPENASRRMGQKHKVRNFFNNILSPNSRQGDVTIDTHAMAAAHMRPLSGSSAEVFHGFGNNLPRGKQPDGWQATKAAGVSGAEGTYGLYADAHRELAAELGILPRELQSITWEAIRGLFPARFKNARNVAAADAIWRRYRNGEITDAQAREEINTLAGGVAEPSWIRSGARRYDPAQTASYERDLSDDSLPSRRSRPAAGRTGSGTPGDVPTEVGRAFHIREQSRGGIETELVLTEEFVARAAQIAETLRKRLDAAGLKDISVRVAERMWAIAGGEEFEIDGRYVKGIIDVALDAESPTATLNHESVHAMRRLGLFSDKEWAILERKSRKTWMAEFEIADGYSAFPDWIQAEEGVAHAYAKWLEGAEMDGVVAKSFRKIQVFLKELARTLTGLDFRTAEDIFQSMASGRIGARPRDAKGRFVSKTQSQEQAQFAIRQALSAASNTAGQSMMNFVKHGKSDGETVGQYSNRKMIDYLRPLLDFTRTAGGTVQDAHNAYLQARLADDAVIARIQKMHDDRVMPMVEALAKAGASLEDLHSYLYALHAEERNRVVGLRNDPASDMYKAVTDHSIKGASGWSTNEAKAMLQKLRADPRKFAGIREAAKMARSILDENLLAQRRAGLISADTYDALTKQWKNYVPLRADDGRDENGDFSPHSGRGFDVRGREFEGATGRFTEAENIVAWTVALAERTHMRVEHNNVGKAVLRFLSQNDPTGQKLARVYWSGSGTFGNIQKAPEVHQRTLNKAGQVVDKIVPPSTISPAMFAVKNGGQVFYIEFADEKVGIALKKMGTMHLDVVSRLARKWTGFQSLVNTRANPAFVPINIIRDAATGGIHLLDEGFSAVEVAGILASIPKAWGALWRNARGRAGQGATDQALKEYVAAGGKISFEPHKTMEDTINELRGHMNDAVNGKPLPKAAWQAFVKFIGDLNDAGENGMRLAAYMAARNQGKTVKQAAFLGRDLTVDFKKHGEVGPTLNSWYVFFNASIQGNYNIATRLAKSKKVRRAAYMIAASGVLMDLLNRALSGEDDDGEDYYSKMLRTEPWKFERQMVIFYGSGEGDYFSIPLPYGYNAIYHLGVQAGAAAFGDVDPLQAVLDTIRVAFDAFNPIGSGGTWWNQLAPTVLDPAVDIWQNMSFFGSPISPTRFPNDIEPDSQRHFMSTPDIFRGAADIANTATGGNKVEPGLVDVSPDTLEHLWGYVSGGIGRFFSQATDVGVKTATGRTDELEWSEIPIVRSFRGKFTDDSRRSEYYKLREDVVIAKERLKDYIDGGDREGAADFRARHKVEIRSFGVFDAIEKELKKVRKVKRAVDFNDNLSREEKIERLKPLEASELRLMNIARSRYAKNRRRAD